MDFEWSDSIKGGIGAIIGSLLTVLGFRSRLDRAEVRQMKVEKACEDLKDETLAMFLEIRKDIKKLIAKTGNRRYGDDI